MVRSLNGRPGTGKFYSAEKMQKVWWSDYASIYETKG